MHAALGVFAGLLVLKSAYLQLWTGRDWDARASRQHFRIDSVPAPRGQILDASGARLVESMDRVTLAVSPKELRDRDRPALAGVLRRLGVPRDRQLRAVSPSETWIQMPGRFMPGDVAELRGMRGVYTTPVPLRSYSASPGLRALLGALDSDGRARGGLELALDSILGGTPGRIKMTVDPAGKREREVPVGRVSGRTQGSTVVLTVERDLQSIAEVALRDAVVARSAVGGDIVIVDPHSGDILAMASYGSRIGFATTAVLAEPYEPGSSVKPLLVARLLELERAKPGDTVETGSELVIPGRRSPITDDHPAPSRSLHDVVKHSSNIGMVKFAGRLTVREQYEAYRDFGFGMTTGLDLPGEAKGALPPPARWTQVTKSSTAIGYGMSITTLQLAMAFASIANGGELLEPVLVKEIRDPDGEVRFQRVRRVVRRVMSPQVAAEVRSMLRSVVQGGTASSANLTLGPLAGKTGTARKSAGPAGYVPGAYNATFAGMFPVNDPQFVIAVRLDDPEGSYGGVTAAPVTRAVLQAALVAQHAALDRSSLLAGASRERESGDSHPGGPAGASLRGGRTDERVGTRVIDLRAALEELAGSTEERPVPRIADMPVRAAVFALHQSGFRVRLREGGDSGRAKETTPPAGTLRKPGDTILLHSGQ